MQALAARYPNLRAAYVATREGGGHLSAEAIRTLMPGADPARAHVAACGPPSLLDAAREIWREAPWHVITETFTSPASPAQGIPTPGAPTRGAPIHRIPAPGTVRFLRSDRAAPIGEGTLLQQAEAAGLAPEFGCRMGICRTCTCRKATGAVRNVLTGEVSVVQDEDIQLCVSVPAGDIALQI